jgi:hypothetical protein
MWVVGRGAQVGARQLTWASLVRQRLLRRATGGAAADVEALVGRLVGLQAQEPASPYVAVANRLEVFDPTVLDDLLGDAALVKATLMRITLHLARAVDHPVWHAAVQPTLRAARLGDARYTGTGLVPDDGLRLVPALCRHAAQPRSPAELTAALAEHVGEEAAPWAWWALRSFAPLRHAVTGPPWAFGRRPSYVAVDPGADLADWAARSAARSEAALAVLVARYLEGYGPATVADAAQFLLVPRSRVAAAVAALESDGAVVRLPSTGRAPLWDVLGGHLPSPDEAAGTAPPRLLGMWDNVLLAYADRSRLVPADLRRVVSRVNGDLLPTVVVDGQVAGVWRFVPGAGAADDPVVEVSAYRDVDRATWDDLAAEAARLLGWAAPRDPALFGRYGHWWAKLPEPARVRRLPG